MICVIAFVAVWIAGIIGFLAAALISSSKIENLERKLIEIKNNNSKNP